MPELLDPARIRARRANHGRAGGSTGADGRETAGEFGIIVTGPRAVSHDASLRVVPRPDAGEGGTFAELLSEWLPLTYALNAVNRSMGSDDLYPFTLAQPVIEKLDFVHRRVRIATAAAAVTA